MSTTCKYCPAALPPPPPRPRRGARRTVCEPCSRFRKKMADEKCHARRDERRRAGVVTVKAASRGFGSSRPLDSVQEARELAGRERRFREAVADGLGMDVLLERFPDARYLMLRLGLRLQPHGGYPLGVP
jgi:hypothetical protein